MNKGYASKVTRCINKNECYNNQSQQNEPDNKAYMAYEDLVVMLIVTTNLD